MGEIKHTPGPFEIRYPEGFIYTIIDGNGRTVATIDGQHGDLETSEEHEERHLADAKLIAAAPDMLSVLRDVLEELTTTTEYNPAMNDLTSKIDSVIKKATE